MTPDLSYYWEGAREWCEDNKWNEEKKRLHKGILLLHTQHPYPFPGFSCLYRPFFSIQWAKNIDRLLIFGALVVHPERRY